MQHMHIDFHLGESTCLLAIVDRADPETLSNLTDQPDSVRMSERFPAVANIVMLAGWQEDMTLKIVEVAGIEPARYPLDLSDILYL